MQLDFVGGTEASEGELWAGWRLWLFSLSFCGALVAASVRVSER